MEVRALKSRRVDQSALRLQIARRLIRETDAPGKLAMLARLQRRYVECRLPKESETRVEQSFNEQLFAKIFGYSTLFSHGALPYNLRPKNYASRARKYDDFSLGKFWGDERDTVLATAELKDPAADLDALQVDRKEKISPVDQALRVARGFPSCMWVVVSNFRELRLYRVGSGDELIATFDLHEVRTPRQLAALCAHFDHNALIGSKGLADMTIALDPQHPSAPIDVTDGAFRVVATFTPKPSAIELPMFAIYDAIREAAISHFGVKNDRPNRAPQVPLQVADGWCSFEKENARLAASSEGQIRCSIRHLRQDGGATEFPDAGFWEIARNVGDFLEIAELVCRSTGMTCEGTVSIELREIRGWQLIFNADDLHLPNNDTNAGVADQNEIMSGDVSWRGGLDAARVVAHCMGELGLGFRAPTGERVRFDHNGLIQHFVPRG